MSFRIPHIFLLKVFFSKILNLKSVLGRKMSKAIVLLYLYNPGSIFYISVYTENLYMTLQLFVLFYLINNPPETLLTFSNMTTLTYPILLAIGLKSNGVLYSIFMLVPIILAMLRGFDKNYSSNSSFNIIKITVSRS